MASNGVIKEKTHLKEGGGTIKRDRRRGAPPFRLDIYVHNGIYHPFNTSSFLD